MNLHRTHFLVSSLVLPLSLSSVLLSVQGAARKPATPPPVLTTNLMVVTNVIVRTITNYVVTTNLVVSTNGLPTEPARKSKKVSTDALPDLSWVPPDDSFDWVQLKSGEWLKGWFKGMQKRELEFTSKEMDDQTFDWKDIRQLRTHRTVDVLLENDLKASGVVTVTPTQITVLGETNLVFAHDQIVSLTPGGSKERNYWSGKLSVGLTLRAGNTEEVEYNAQAHLERRTPATRLSLDYIGNVSSVDDVESANDHRVNSEFDLWLSRRFYLVLPFAEYYRDPFQNLAHRATVGAGVGYDLIDRPRINWSITTGPAYQKAWFESIEPDEPTTKSTAALVFGTKFDWDITRRLELSLEYRGQYTSREVGETTHHGVANLSFEISNRLDLDLSFIWDRIAQPKPGADGVVPKPDDFRLVAGLGVKF